MNVHHISQTLLAALVLYILAAAIPSRAGTASKTPTPAADTVTQQGYRIDQPGTITFTVGMVIKGKVEKPQVMIFLPKEKAYYRELHMSHSFKDAIDEPLPFEPLLE